MTYADPALIDAREYLMDRGISGRSIGIVGDESHQSSGGYHVGNDVLAMIGKLTTDYSKRQTEKDRPGSNAAMALDIGGLSAQQLYELTAWLIAQCRAGTPDTRNIREVIGRRTPQGGVTRYDALGIQPDSGTKDHETHTHISYYRDSEGQDKTSVFRRYFEGEPPPEQAAEVEDEEQEEDTVVVTFVYALINGKGTWGMGVISGGIPKWYEAYDQGGANGLSAGTKRSAAECSAASYANTKAQFVAPAAPVKA